MLVNCARMFNIVKGIQTGETTFEEYTCYPSIERVAHFEDLEDDCQLALKLGLAKLLDRKLLYKMLARYDTVEKALSIKYVNREVVALRLKGRTDVILDMHSTVETVYGQQEMAAEGIIHITPVGLVTIL